MQDGTLSNQAHTVKCCWEHVTYFLMLFIYIYDCGVSLHKLFSLSNLLILRSGTVMPTKFAIWIQNVILKLGTFTTLCQCKCLSCEALVIHKIWQRWGFVRTCTGYATTCMEGQVNWSMGWGVAFGQSGRNRQGYIWVLYRVQRKHKLKLFSWPYIILLENLSELLLVW